MFKRVLKSVLFALVLASACAGLQAKAATQTPDAVNEGQPLAKLMALGSDAAARNDWPASTGYYLAAHHSAPSDPEPLFDLGLAASQMPGRELQAVAWFEAFLAAAPSDGRAAAVDKQIERLEQGARDRSARLFQIAEQTVAPLPPAQRMSPAQRLAALAAKLGDSKRMIYWLNQWTESQYGPNAASRIPDYQTGSLFEAVTSATQSVPPDSPIAKAALAWAVDYGAGMVSRVDDKPGIESPGLAVLLADLAKADLKLGRREAAETLLQNLQAHFESAKGPATLIQLIGVQVAMGRRPEAEQNLRTLRPLLQAARFETLDANAETILSDWSMLGNITEARGFMDLFEAAAARQVAKKMEDDGHPERYGLSRPTDKEKFILRMDENLLELRSAMKVVSLAAKIGDFERAKTEADRAWAIERKGRAIILDYGRTHPRSEHSSLSDNQVLNTSVFYQGVVDLARAAKDAKNTSELNALVYDTFTRAQIEAEDDAKAPLQPPASNYDPTNTNANFDDQAFLRYLALRGKIEALLDLLTTADQLDQGSFSKISQSVRDLSKMTHSRGSEFQQLARLAAIEYKNGFDALFAADLAEALQRLEGCVMAKDYYCYNGKAFVRNGAYMPFFPVAGLLLTRDGGAAAFDKHVARFERSEVWRDAKASHPDLSIRDYVAAARRYAVSIRTSTDMDHLASLTARQREQTWADYAEQGIPAALHLDDRSLIADSLANSAVITGDATYSWSAIADEISMTLALSSFIDKRRPLAPNLATAAP